MREKIKIMEEGFGVDGVKIRMVYRNGDGTKICSGTIE